MANPQPGGAFLPNQDVQFTSSSVAFASGCTVTLASGATFTAASGSTFTLASGATIAASGATFTAATLNGATTVATGATITGPAITAPVITGAATVASGATFTTPTVLFTAQALTATGATGGAGTAMSTIVPAVVSCTGASGSAIDIATGAGVAGAVYMIRNINATGVITVYAVGGTLNGATGTTGVALSPTGTKAGTFICTAAGTWSLVATSAT